MGPPCIIVNETWKIFWRIVSSASVLKLHCVRKSPKHPPSPPEAKLQFNKCDRFPPPHPSFPPKIDLHLNLARMPQFGDTSSKLGDFYCFLVIAVVRFVNIKFCYFVVINLLNKLLRSGKGDFSLRGQRN